MNMMQPGFIAKYKSSTIYVGSVPLGGDYPIRLQSMTNTDTLDTKASVVQCIRIIEAGGDFVRLTAQGVREAQNLAIIKDELRKKGFNTPLIADIHFNPAAAETAARLVEKVRINPGNYTDKRASFQKVEFTEKEYSEELERIHERLLPLINIGRDNKTVIRIGINHGSLSDRIMTRYGNTPEGMVRSAMEFIEIFRKENFSNLVLSMKSSDTAIMIEATRMLVVKMLEEGMSYPLHLGVTEAGEGEDGRIRSASGIGALLLDGIGDTIRVSLSEDPEKEIPVARKLATFFPRGIAESKPKEPVAYKSPSGKPELCRKINGPLVVSDFTSLCWIGKEDYINAGYGHDLSGRIIRTDNSADLIITEKIPDNVPEAVILAVPYKIWLEKRSLQNVFPIFSPVEFIKSKYRSDKLNILITGKGYNIKHFIKPDPSTTLIIYSFNADEPYEPYTFMLDLQKSRLEHNIILKAVFSERDREDLQIRAAGILGGYITDNRIAGISLVNSYDAGNLTNHAFSILQSTGKRITRTVYLSCPTCGRTKFNLQETVRKVKDATSHFKGLKIAVMGCIVNGPGEMAGADYGYVGAAPGKVHIYKGTVPVLKNIPEESAVMELLKVIEEDSPINFPSF